jgi:predicted ATPase
VPSSDPEEKRFRLFDSLTRLLKSIADAQPLMIVLDDLQEADQTSLLMLRFSARQLKEPGSCSSRRTRGRGAELAGPQPTN